MPLGISFDYDQRAEIVGPQTLRLPRMHEKQVVPGQYVEVEFFPTLPIRLKRWQAVVDFENPKPVPPAPPKRGQVLLPEDQP